MMCRFPGPLAKLVKQKLGVPDAMEEAGPLLCTLVGVNLHKPLTWKEESGPAVYNNM